VGYVSGLAVLLLALLAGGVYLLRPPDLVTIKVPDVVAMTTTQAQETLSRAGLKWKVLEVESTRRAMWDRVVRQLPRAGARAARREAVLLTVMVEYVTQPLSAAETRAALARDPSLVPVPRTRSSASGRAAWPGGPVNGMPDVTGMTLLQARRKLRPLGLDVAVAGRRYSTQTRRGRIVSQRPKGGGSAPASDEVRVVLSRGRRPGHR
jgi:beta-lactam-binding protein with PASTA domain